MTIVIQGGQGGALPDPERFGLSDRDIVDIFAMGRPFGYFRHDLATGHLYLSEEACALYGIARTSGPVNQVEVMSKVHPDDVEMMLRTLEERARQALNAHYIYRVSDGNGGYRFTRLVWRHRDNGAEGEVVGVIYVFLDRVPGVRFMTEGTADAH